MRRVGFFAAFLLLLGLTTATAASFDVQAEDITSFTTDVSIEVPTTTTPPPLATGTFYLVDAPANARMVLSEPTTTGGNEKASFDYGPSNVETEAGPLQPGGKAHYVSWASPPLPLGLRYDNQTVRVHFTRTGAAGGTLVAALFACPAGASGTTVVPTCEHLRSGSSTGETIDITNISGQVPPDWQLRLKMVSGSPESSAIQWGYKANNRSARIEVLP